MKEMTKEQALDEFVGREVYTCQSSLIEEVLRLQLFTVDDVNNMYRPFDGKLIDPSICVSCNTNFPFLDSETGECESCFEANQTPQDIYEWWLVSPWFGKKLLMEGEPIIDNGFGVWWGRCTTGQAISMDHVVGQIYDSVMNYTG